MVRLLLVANKTLASGEVSDFVKDRMAKEEDCRFTLLVPATPRSNAEAGNGRRPGWAARAEGCTCPSRARARTTGSTPVVA